MSVSVNSFFLSRFFIIGIFTWGLMGTPSLFAQDKTEVDEVDAEPVPAQAVGVNLAMEPQKILAAKRFQLVQTFAVEVDEIRQVCDLNEQQASKLRVAAKGAVKKLTEEWRKNNRQLQGVVAEDGVIVEEPTSDAEKSDESTEPIEEIKDADEIDESTAQMIMTGPGGNPFTTTIPTEHAFWTKTVAAVLTDSQAGQLETFRNNRESAKRNSQIVATIDTLSVELALTETQHAKLRGLITPQLQQVSLKCQSIFDHYLLFYYASKVDEKELSEILSPAQLQKWKLFMAPTKQIGQMLESEIEGEELKQQ